MFCCVFEGEIAVDMIDSISDECREVRVELFKVFDVCVGSGDELVVKVVLFICVLFVF